MIGRVLPVSTGIMPDTIAAAGVFSSRAVEATRLHPSRLKSLASKGQGYLYASDRPDLTAARPRPSNRCRSPKRRP